MAAGQWTALEITKLVVAVATPIVVVLIGVVISRAARRIEQAQWANRKVIERRLELYDVMAGPLNDLYCFFAVRGHFRDIEPPAAVALKRTLDKLFYVNEFLMGEEFGQRYHALIDACYLTYAGFAQDAKLRGSIELQRSQRRAWNEAWERCFVDDPGEVTEPEVVGERYRALMRCFAETLGVRAVTSTHGS